jgi:predicted amidohydrolase
MGDTGITPSEQRLTIRQVVVDGTGSVICMYDKIHLCDYGDCAETRYFVAGDR